MTDLNRRDYAMKLKHRQRALAAIALHICVTDLTDGFCGPDQQTGECQRHGRHLRGTCTARAEGCLHAIEARGCSIVWDFDKALLDEGGA